MLQLIVALAEAAHEAEFPGEDFAILALVLAGIAFVFAAVATWIVTPKGTDGH